MQGDLRRREEEQDAIHYSLCFDSIFDVATTQATTSSNNTVTAVGGNGSVGGAQDVLSSIQNLHLQEGMEEDTAHEGYVIEEAEEESHDNSDVGNHDTAAHVRRQTLEKGALP